jgi:hypothetical protein
MCTLECPCGEGLNGEVYDRWSLYPAENFREFNRTFSIGNLTVNEYNIYMNQ